MEDRAPCWIGGCAWSRLPGFEEQECFREAVEDVPDERFGEHEAANIMSAHLIVEVKGIPYLLSL